MIIITDRPGQLSNRLWSYTPLIAFCLEHNINLKVLYFNHYSRYFVNVNRIENIKIGLVKSFNSYKVARYLLNFLKRTRTQKFFTQLKVVDYTFPDFETLEKYIKKNRGLIFMQSWNQPVNIELISKHKKSVIEIFKPKLSICNHIDHLFKEKRELNDIVVGVHIRKGDYKQFNSGKYFFSNNIYLRYMKLIQEQLNAERKTNVVFFLCSDEQIDLNAFLSLNAFNAKKPTAVHDQYALSKCNYIFGPPSTFSMWASFIGNVPLAFIETEGEKITLSDFSPIVARDVFEDGRTYQLS